MSLAAVVGAGSWGTALAGLLAANGHSVRLWARDPALADAMRTARRNPRYLTEIPLPEAVEPTSDLAGAVAGALLVVSVVPSHAVRETMAAAASHLAPEAVVVSASKGIENETLKRMTEVLADALPGIGTGRLAVLSGPSFAEEVARGMPTAVTVASAEEVTAERVREAFAAPRFRVYTSTDVIGVELGGAVKNVIAIATGIADGLGSGTSARAALITRGLAEISRLGMAMGGEQFTFMGLAGLGDLVLTCTGDLSRNRTVGLRLGRGETLEEILADLRMVAEGIRTTRSARELARRAGVEMPITEQVHGMLYDSKSAQVVVEELMTREYKPEFERR
ncbi:MAG TPA: NAD(P)H-dependent glycerol-3-phosphate dehydrogenase [Gemmatimonadota bacterium]|nr:NAD(P)H-dependent glycerol-3-phosphate dehydrogenase [Gemmatimonadota bacterium]